MDAKTYKPELKTLTPQQEEAVNRHALVVDGEMFSLVIQHMQTDFINEMLFGKEPVSMNDQYFRGFLAGLEAYYGFIHDRAEMSRDMPL